MPAPRTSKTHRAATHVPVSLQKEAVMRTDGSYGQLITWACLDFPDEISAQVRQTALGTGHISRQSRSARATPDAPEARVLIGPVFQPEEDAAVRDLLERIQSQATTDDGIDADRAQRLITRTQLHIAALRTWCTQHPSPPPTETEGTS